MPVNPSIPVVILEASYGSLGIARSLGRWGVPVYAVDAKPLAPALWSRYCCGRVICDIENDLPAVSFARLRALAARAGGERPILIPTGDGVARFVAEHAGILRRWYRFQEQPGKLVHRLASKEEMHDLAVRNGIPTPRTLFPQSRADVMLYAEQGTFPVVLKAIDGARLYQRCGTKMTIVHSPAELLANYDRMEDPHNRNLMLQEYLPGADDTIWMFNGYFDANSDCLFGMTGKKIRQCPITKGVTSLGVCLQNDEVAELTRKFMKAIGYRGIVDIGFRYDARDGQYKVLDVNPRVGATFRLFVSDNGMDVVRALYLDLTGQPISPGQPQWGRKWVVEDLDLASTVRYMKRGELTLRAWIKSFRGVQESAYFAPSDPLPVLARALTNVALGGRRIAGKLRRPRRPPLPVLQPASRRVRQTG
jgi:predicted ATP-grasp superfamily ATP-dependent carboligase